MHILIAEDDYISRKFLYTFLSDYGQVKLAVNGLEAVNQYTASLTESNPFDLICMDIMMPEKDGVEALKAIRSLEKTWPGNLEKKSHIIMTTALADKPYVLKALQLGCDAYILKPINQNHLIAKMREMALLP